MSGHDAFERSMASLYDAIREILGKYTVLFVGYTADDLRWPRKIGAVV